MELNSVLFPACSKVKMTWISTSVLFHAFSKLYILTELSANDVKFISVYRQKLDLSKYIYLWYRKFYTCRDTARFYEHKKWPSYIKDGKQEVNKSKTSWMTIHVLPIYKNSVFRDLFIAEGWMFLILSYQFTTQQIYINQTLRILRLISISTNCIATFHDLEILPKVRLAQLSCLGDFFVGDQSCLSIAPDKDLRQLGIYPPLFGLIGYFKF